MYKIIKFTILTGIIGVIVHSSCGNDEAKMKNRDTSKVEFREKDGKWTLYRNKQPYFIKGAHGCTHLDWLKEIGGNSILVYEKELSDSLLNLADSMGLTVSVILDVGAVRFPENDYNNRDYILNQRERITQTIKRYYTHPAILFWVIGNELHLVKRKNNALWREVNKISRMIRTIDNNHPITTTIAAFPTESYQPLQMKLLAPDLDFISLTMYYGPRLKREAESFIWGINGPFLVTEWAGKPYWECLRTEWDAIIEHSTTKNAALYYHNYYLIYEQNKDKCIGGYVFYWGQKQERTHTVFSLIIENKYKTQAFESLQDLWTGTDPENWCPRIDTFYIQGYSEGPHYLSPDSVYTAQLKAHDPDNDSLFMKWELRTEGYYRGKTGGDAEKLTEIVSQSDTIFPYKDNFLYKAPKTEGQYRLFVYVLDNHNWIAISNIPVYVMP